MEVNKVAIAVGVIFTIRTKEFLEYDFQNFLRGEAFLWNGKSYSYLPVTYLPPEKNITRGSGQAEFKLPNIPEILAIVVANNYFKDATITAYIVTSDFPNSPLIQQSRLVVNSYGIEEGKESDGEIVIRCGKRTNTINGTFPNVFYTTGRGANSDLIGYIPEVPLNNTATIN